MRDTTENTNGTDYEKPVVEETVEVVALLGTGGSPGGGGHS